MTAVEISANQARDLTDRIKIAVEATWELIKEAYVSRAWSALGYASWDDYCTREFGTSRIKLPREERQEVVASMREIGMSTRAIAAATGMGKTQISNDLRGVRNRTPDADHAPVTGTDGKTYTPRPAPRPAAPESSFDDEPEPEEPPQKKPEPEQPERPAPQPAAANIPQNDLDELNSTPVHKPLDEDYHDPKEHLIALMGHLKKASKAIEDAIFTAKHLDSWGQGPVSGDLRALLDELDETLTSGGFNAELARLLEGEN